MICNHTNIVWIERGIILNLMEYIVNNFKHLASKQIIIEDLRYRRLLRSIFPSIKFSKFTKHKKKNFYFNIRKIIRNQDIVIDYINNYSDYIYGKDIQLVPYYDNNDMIIMYQVSKDRNGAQYYKNLFYNFSACQRGNYYNQIWDYFREKIILVNLQNRLGINFQYIVNLIDNTFKKYNNPQYVNMYYEINNKTKKNTKSINDDSTSKVNLDKIKKKILEINKKF